MARTPFLNRSGTKASGKKSLGTKTPSRANSSVPELHTAIKALSLKDIRATHNISRHAPPGALIVRQAETDLRDHIDNPDYCVISLHGPSKQGKSSLLRPLLRNTDEVLGIEASDGMRKIDLYRGLLQRAGAVIEQGATESDSVSVKVNLGIVSLGYQDNAETPQRIFQGSLLDAQWVSSLIANATQARVLVIDSFHHFSKAEQTALSKDFTVFAGAGFTIVAAGTWKQANYLVERNGDLRGQHAHVSVDPWDEAELQNVVRTGARALGLSLPRSLVVAIAKQSNGSIAALQQICARYYDDVRTGAIEYVGQSPSQLVNMAAQKLSNDMANDMADTLFKASQWGTRDATGRRIVSYVIEEVLSVSATDLRAGFALEGLHDRVNARMQAAAEAASQEFTPIDRAEFNQKLKAQWPAHQASINNTPMFVWDQTIDRFVVNDAMLTFIHRASWAQLGNAFAETLQTRSDLD